MDDDSEQRPWWHLSRGWIAFCIVMGVGTALVFPDDRPALVTARDALLLTLMFAALLLWKEWIDHLVRCFAQRGHRRLDAEPADARVARWTGVLRAGGSVRIDGSRTRFALRLSIPGITFGALALASVHYGWLPAWWNVLSFGIFAFFAGLAVLGLAAGGPSVELGPDGLRYRMAPWPRTVRRSDLAEIVATRETTSGAVHPVLVLDRVRGRSVRIQTRLLGLSERELYELVDVWYEHGAKTAGPGLPAG